MKDIEQILAEITEARDQIRNLTEENESLEQELTEARSQRAAFEKTLRDLAYEIQRVLR